jgi:hypothetical protein
MRKCDNRHGLYTRRDHIKRRINGGKREYCSTFKCCLSDNLEKWNQ